MTNRKQRVQSRPPERSPGKESGLVQRVRLVLRDAFPEATPHIVAGYSGGKDSLALLLVLRELARLGACRVTAVHVDHRLRPDSADAAEQAMRIAGELDIPCVLKVAEGSLRRAFPGQSVEDIARRFRYQSLLRVLNEVDGDAVAVAHHRRDQAETVLLHLLRGSGLTGLSGMAVDGLMPVSWMAKPEMGPVTMLRVIRPLLDELPGTLDDVVQASGMPVLEDPSNDDPAFRRNRIRHELLPLMEDIAPGAMGRLTSLADLVREDDIALDDVANRLLERSVEGEALDWETFQGAAVGLQRRVVRSWISGRRGTGDLSHDRVDAVIALGSRGHGGRSVEIGGGWSVWYRDGQLRLRAGAQ